LRGCLALFSPSRVGTPVPFSEEAHYVPRRQRGKADGAVLCENAFIPLYAMLRDAITAITRLDGRKFVVFANHGIAPSRC
jgi:hypothetical protein